MIAAHHAAYVLDASVAFKWFTAKPEPDRDAAMALRERHVTGRCRLIVPELFFLEMLNVFKFHAKATEEDASATLEVLEHFHFDREPLSWDLLRKTNAIAWSYGVTMYDACYVALAELKGFPLVTADDGLVKKMRGHSIVVRLSDLKVN
jgi:predicted nucleic acid-binding protein